MFKKFRFIGLALALVLSVGLAACGNSGGSSNGQLGQSEITIPYVSWAGAIASSHVAGALLEKAGYEVSLKQVGAGEMFSSVASGSADALTAAWLPVTHQKYWKEYGDKLEKLQKTIDKAPLGLTVPKYMKINSIKDLKGNTKLGKKLDWTITGIDPGAGEMAATKKVLKKYGLDKWKLQASSGPAMTAALKRAEDNHKPIIVTLWKPHWAFATWDLKILKDPKKVYGTADSIYTVGRKDLKKDAPAAYKILSQFNWNYDQMGKVMKMDHNGVDPKKAAQKFLKKHPDLVKKWMKGVKTSKK
ncbi:MAG TPA: glycine betaine ABC transporter substrate-binding protein [Bacillales bacterium]|nr:glycine betaine ABC transporter substrate-binding protein [Bacillales bacterium]